LLALQRLAGNAAVTNFVEGEQTSVQRTAVHDALGSPGTPLEPGVRADMEARLGADFSDVRVHSDTVAHRAAESVAAHAFTSGSHIVFQQGRYDTGSTAGTRMLAHELTHVIQQRRGPVPGTRTPDGLMVSDPADAGERAAEANADRVMSGPAPVQRATGPAEPAQTGSAGAAPVLQRRVETGARVGFEFQELGSKVEVIGTGDSDQVEFEGQDSEEGHDSESVYEVTPPEHFGRGWTVVADGANLEFVTEPFATLAELRASMRELVFVAKDIDVRGVYELEGTNIKIRVRQPDDSGQPQVNPDIPLDTYRALLDDMNANDERRAQFFGAHGPFSWRSEDTAEELDMLGEAAGKIEAVSGDTLEIVLGVPKGDPERVATVKGLLQFMVSAALHKAYFPTNTVTKDLPILLKTNMGRLWQDLKSEGTVRAGVRARAVVDLLRQNAGDDVQGARDELREVATEVLAGRDPVWARDTTAANIGRPDETEQPGPSRKLVLVELRRAPVLPIEKWLEFAEQSFDYFVQDPENRFHGQVAGADEATPVAPVGPVAPVAPVMGGTGGTGTSTRTERAESGRDEARPPAAEGQSTTATAPVEADPASAEGVLEVEPIPVVVPSSAGAPMPRRLVVRFDEESKDLSREEEQNVAQWANRVADVATDIRKAGDRRVTIIVTGFGNGFRSWPLRAITSSAVSTGTRRANAVVAVIERELRRRGNLLEGRNPPVRIAPARSRGRGSAEESTSGRRRAEAMVR